MHDRVRLLAFAAALGLTACGSTPGTTPAPSATAASSATPASSAPASPRAQGPCDLVTPAQVGEALGARVHPGIEQSVGEKRNCSYLGAVDASLNVFVATWGGGSAAFEAERRPGARRLGDNAFLQTDLNVTITALSGGTIVQVSVTPNAPHAEQTARRLIDLALAACRDCAPS